MDSPSTVAVRAVPLDRIDVASWTNAIVGAALDEIRSCFAGHHAQGPEVYWSPADEIIVPPQLRFLQRYWRERSAGRPAPHVRDIDAMDMKPALGFIVLMDVIDGGEDFRCRLFGSAVAAVSGFDMT